MKKLIKIFFTISFILSNISIAQNGDTVVYKTEEIEVISNRVATDIFSSPTRVEIIPKETIKNTNGETLADVISTAGGVFIKSYGGNSILKTISLNGMGAEHTLILLNGFKINSFQNAQLDLTTISKEDIERIEVMNNGASSLYGSEALGGVVNIITRLPSEQDLGIRLNTQFGSYSQRKYLISVNKKFSNYYINYSQSFENSDNDYEFISGFLSSSRRRNSEYKIKNYSVDASLLLNQVKLNFYSGYNDIFRKLPGAESIFLMSPRAEQKDRNWFNSISLEKILSDNYKLNTSVNFQNNLMNYNAGFEFEFRSYYKNLVYALNSILEMDFRNIRMSNGAEVVFATLESNELEPNINRKQIGIFSASEFDIGKLKIFPSVRYDHISDVDENIITAKLGGNYKPFNEEDLHIRFSVGNNFAAPTFNELYWKESGNKDLKPERSLNIDAGIIYKVNFIGNLVFDLTFTKIFAKDKIVWKPVSSFIWSPVNIGKSESDVYSISAEYFRSISDFSLRANINYSHTSSIKKSMDIENDPSYNKQIFYIPEQFMKTNVELEYKGMGLNLFYNFIGRRFIDFENNYFLPAADVLDGNIFYRVKNKDNLTFTFKIEVNNILNANYEIIQLYPMPLRNYKLNLTVEY